MNTKTVFTCLLAGGVCIGGTMASGALVTPVDALAITSSSVQQDRFYADGTRAINEGRWADATTSFDKVIEQHGSRTEGALYWKAYAQNKEGRSADALNTCARLRQSYPKSRWLDECGALEIEVRGKSGHPILPQSEPDVDLKLLALNALMQQDEARALPIVQQVLNGKSPQNLKERALFVLAQSNSTQAQDLLGRIARGQDNPDLQVRAIQMLALSKRQQAASTLAEVYRSTTDESVKKAVLEGYLLSGDNGQLAQAARKEADIRLAQCAISELGAMHAVPDLLTLYRETNQADMKASILNAFITSGQKGAGALESIASTEQNPELRRKAIRNLGLAGGSAAAPSLITIYRKASDPATKQAVIEALFLAGDAHDMVALAKTEKDAAMKQTIVERLALMHNKEASDYMLEILNK